MGSPAFAETLEKLYPWVGAGVPILNLHIQPWAENLSRTEK